MRSARSPGAIVLAVVTVLLAGCAANLQAEVQRREADYLAQVTPTTQRLGGKALVALPWQSTIQAGLLKIPGLRREPLEQMVFVEDAKLVTDSMAIAKTGIFDFVETMRLERPSSADIGDADYRLWAEINGEAVEWTLATRNGRSQRILPHDRRLGRANWLNSLGPAVLNAAADLELQVTRQPLPVASWPGAAR